MINEELEVYIKKKIFPLYLDNDGGHDINHVKYVINRSLRFASMIENINLDMVYVVAAYHDVGEGIDRKNHERVSSEMLRNDIELKKYFNDEEINIILREALEQDDITLLKNSLLDELDLESDIYVVSSVVKKELVKNAIKSLIIASIGIIIYVAIRFKFNYAISGIVALIHDVLFTFLFFSVFKIEMDSVFIAAILTIIGYSINDTIVTFDIIRENYKNKYKNNITEPKDLDTLVDMSIKRTLYRTILTTITTTIPVIILLIFGSKEIMNFNIALLVGFIAGVYSSIFISNMLWLFLEKRRITKPKKQDDDDEIQELKVKGINC
jgi:SecD/SecF fusion protein